MEFSFLVPFDYALFVNNLLGHLESRFKSVKVYIAKNSTYFEVANMSLIDIPSTE